MRPLLLGFILLASLATFARQQPATWKLQATPKGTTTYLLQLTGTVQPGWKIYAIQDEATGLEPLRLSWEAGDVVAQELKTISHVKSYADPLFDNQVIKVYDGNIKIEQVLQFTGIVPAEFSVKISGFAVNDNEFIPLEESVSIKLEGGTAPEIGKMLSIDLQNPVADCGEKISTAGSSLWAVFGKGFIGGLFALLMPCIFPMLPVTVSFFMKRAVNRKQGIRNGILYGAFIFCIYLLVSLPFHVAGSVNPQIFNIIATDKWVNLVFFLVFLLFALSLFGVFELRLPGASSADRRSGTGSVAGIFFMALTLTIVSFSCTGPILGFLLVNSISEVNGALALTAGLAGFGAALALPFGLFAIFPHWLKKLPRSGSWMETVKKALAFIELALAIKFLSNADLVEHWGLLKREIFIASWLLIALVLSLYLLNIKGWIRHRKWSVSGARTLFGLLAAAFAVYLVPGLGKSASANLKLLSGLAPPLSYSIYGKENLKGKELGPDVINDYEKAVALSKQTGKPMLLDFTGWACVNCRKMEEQVWTKPSVQQVIKENFILVSLYVDDRKELPAAERFVYTTVSGQQKKIRTVGDKWANFQAENFKQVTQPLYVLLSPEETLLNNPVGYTPDEEEYRDWLECGLRAVKGK